jgi:hypothetical protein
MSKVREIIIEIAKCSLCRGTPNPRPIVTGRYADDKNSGLRLTSGCKATFGYDWHRATADEHAEWAPVFEKRAQEEEQRLKEAASRNFPGKTIGIVFIINGHEHPVTVEPTKTLGDAVGVAREQAFSGYTMTLPDWDVHTEAGVRLDLEMPVSDFESGVRLFHSFRAGVNG